LLLTASRIRSRFAPVNQSADFETKWKMSNTSLNCNAHTRHDIVQ
jgi:hypothetical protein